MIIKVDPHTHTLASGHAFGTLEENIRHAAEMGMEALCVTEHFSPLFTPVYNGFPQVGGALTMHDFPKVCLGVRVYAGVEIDIVDTEGHLAFWDHKLPFKTPKATSETSSLADLMLGTRDFAIASVHGPRARFDPDREDFTDMYIKAMSDPRIHAIGHPVRAGLPFDWDEFLSACKEYGKLPEINEHSMDFEQSGSGKLREFAEKCAKENVKVIVSSDAHCSFKVGVFDKAKAMLDEIGFPQELIANTDMQSFEAAIAAMKK